MLRLMNREHRVLDRDAAILAELSQGASHGFASGEGHRSNLLVRQEPGKAEAAVVEVLAEPVRPAAILRAVQFCSAEEGCSLISCALEHLQLSTG